jgi:hypothetical protein
VLVEVALEVVKVEAMAVAVAVGTISVSLAFDGALGGGGGLFDHGLVAAVGRRVAQGETQWKPYYTTSATTLLLHECVEFKQIRKHKS